MTVASLLAPEIEKLVKGLRAVDGRSQIFIKVSCRCRPSSTEEAFKGPTERSARPDLDILFVFPSLFPFPTHFPFPFPSLVPFPYLYKNVCFHECAPNSGPRGSTDMILNVFDAKFHEKKDEILPRACNPSYTLIYSILGI